MEVNTETAQVHSKKNSHRMFLDDVEYLSFVRRLSWSPDGNFFLTPASVYQDLSSNDSGPVTAARSIYTVYGFLKSDITQPAFMLPGIKSYATCIRFNPYLYQKKNNTTPDKPALLDLPYRIVFAVGTTEQVIIYTTESIYPLAVIGNTHYAPLNDFAWDFAGNKLLAASSDGYVSVLQFLLPASDQNSVFGERLNLSDIPEKLRPQFEALEGVQYRKYEEEARDAKKVQFKQMTYKSKNAAAVVTAVNP